MATQSSSAAPPTYNTNGRLNILTGSNPKEYPLSSSSSSSASSQGKSKSDYRDEALRGMCQVSQKLSDLFFSPQNMEALQQGIRYLVYEKSCKKHVIDKQSEEDLHIVMRSIYLQHALNLPYMIVEQVRDLNKKVLDFIVPRVLNEISIYMEYKRRVSTLPVPLARSENTSVTGTKTLELRDF